MTNRNPLSYMGIDETDPPQIIKSRRAPTAADRKYKIGDIWIDQVALRIYSLINVAAGAANWGLITAGNSVVDTINSLAPVLGDIVVSGGTNLTDVNAGNTVTLNLDPAITLATSVTSPIYASAAAMAINPVGALTVTGGAAIDVNAAAGSNITIQLGDAGGANVLEIEDSASATIATIDSNGTATFVGMDGILGAVTPAAATGTTITANTSVTSPLYTAAAADAVLRAGGVNDVVLRLGDNAGATFLRVQDSDSIDVWTIDSNGTFAAFAGLTVTGAFAQTAGTFNVGQDNAANAINIGAGNVARAIAIGNGAGAHTVNIGSAAAGAIAIDTAAGFSIDGANTSNITVTSAGLDLNIQGVGCAVNMTSTEAQNDAIVIESSAANGGVQIRAGTGGVLIGDEADTQFITLGLNAPTVARIITIGGGTQVTAANIDTIRIAPGGATTNANSVKQLELNTGGVTTGQVLTDIAIGTVTSGTHTTNIATGNRAAGTMATNVMTGSGTKTFNLGNADALTTCNIDAITLINDSVNAATSINTGTSTGTVTIGNGLSGAIGVVGGAAVTVDAVGVLELNSSAGIISIGNDADAQNMNIGTGAAARTITIGNGTAATSVVVNSGTGAASFAANATDHTTTIGSTTGVSATIIQSGTGKIDLADTVQEVVADFVNVSGSSVTFRQSPIVQSNASTGAAPTGATGDVNLLCLENGIELEQFVLGAGQTIIAPRMNANGLLVSGDLTAAEGYEYNFGAARANSKHSFTIGTSPAFFLEWQFRVADISGLEPCYIGFRKTQANDATFANYTDFVAYGPNDGIAPGDCAISTQLNTGGLTNTDTNDAWADGATHTLRINVSAVGVVTFLFDGAPPTVTQAFTFDNADVVHPFFRHTFNAAVPGAIDWISMQCGAQ